MKSQVTAISMIVSLTIRHDYTITFACTQTLSFKIATGHRRFTSDVIKIANKDREDFARGATFLQLSHLEVYDRSGRFVGKTAIYFHAFPRCR